MRARDRVQPPGLPPVRPDDVHGLDVLRRDLSDLRRELPARRAVLARRSLPPPAECECFPVGVVPCSSAEFPTCGGACPGGGVCGPLAVYTIEFGSMLACSCLDSASDCTGRLVDGMCPGICQPGWVCYVEPEPAGQGGCVGCIPEDIVFVDP